MVMTFTIDPARHRVIDISHTVAPGGELGRPFAVQRALIPSDRTFRYDVHLTHTHVGTHIEAPRHFFADGKAVSDFPLEYFHGRAVLLRVGEIQVTRESCQRELDDIVRPGDIVVVRNDTGVKLTKEMVYAEDYKALPRLTLSAADYFLEKQVKMLVLDLVQLGADVAETREFHARLMARDVCFVEIVENLHEIRRREFYLMALPWKVQGMDAGWARAIVIEER